MSKKETSVYYKIQFNLGQNFFSISFFERSIQVEQLLAVSKNFVKFSPYIVEATPKTTHI